MSRAKRTAPGITHINLHSVVGQSQAIGILNNEALTATPPRPGRALMANAGLRLLPNGHNWTQVDKVLPRAAITRFVDAKEVVRAKAGETGFAQFAADMTGDAAGAYPADEACLVQVHAVSAAPMPSWCPSRSGELPYQFTNMLRAWDRSRLVAMQAGCTLSVDAIHAHFGEAEALRRSKGSRVGDARYIIWIERFLATAAGYAQLFLAPPPLFVFSQMGTFLTYDMAFYSLNEALLAWALANPRRIVCAGPSYDCEHPGKGHHRDAAGQRRQMQRHARALLFLRAERGPLVFHPERVERAGDDLLVSFAGGEGDLAIDTVRIADPGHYGVSWDGAGAIREVRQVEARTLLVTGPRGPGTLFFGAGEPGAMPGPRTGARTCLRDSASAIGADGEPLFNWCAYRAMPVPPAA